MAKFCSAEYQTNNLLSPVLFEEALPYIPEQAVLIEVAPHGLLQAILKRALPDNVHIPLTQRGHADPLRLLLAAIGRMSFASVSPKVSALYPDVGFPVPRGTLSLAPLVLYANDESTNNDIMHLTDKWSLTVINLNVLYHVKVSGSRIFPLSEELTKVTVSGSEQPPVLHARDLEEDAIELAEDDVYQELAARGLEYTEKYKTIKSIRMGHRDWLVSVAPNGSLSATIEAVLQVYILKAIDESQELRL
ncbi:hypothetical protein FOCC_FOCC007566, partial [Frankliniella occidentalis]